MSHSDAMWLHCSFRRDKLSDLTILPSSDVFDRNGNFQFLRHRSTRRAFSQIRYEDREKNPWAKTDLTILFVMVTICPKPMDLAPAARLETAMMSLSNVPRLETWDLGRKKDTSKRTKRKDEVEHDEVEQDEVEQDEVEQEEEGRGRGRARRGRRGRTR